MKARVCCSRHERFKGLRLRVTVESILRFLRRQ